MEHDAAWLDARRRQIRRLSTLLVVMFVGLTIGFFVDRTTHHSAWFYRSLGDHTAYDAARQHNLIGMIVFAVVVIAGFGISYVRGKLVREYNRVVLEGDPQLRGNDIPIVD